jgi:lipopolysaccharide transport system ATP-binding protein
MSDTVIRADKLGKKFLIGHKVEYDAILGEALVRRARNLWRKGVDMMRGRAVVEGDIIEEFWALRDLDFEIRRGEVVSIIGHNGAGKTTLLKILSRILEPTEGRVEISGRVASLLEVGTGFHPELTGRENIFLNGAILGMTRKEVHARLDQIVDFSGVEKFIDTPVKRYSVGMYARLAFAVAAHLETEILFVDEVLAVGDAEFQKRCLDRMSEVASAGRTVLFVSHNLAAVTALTHRGIVLKGGRLIFDGPIEAAVARYAESLSKGRADRDWGRGTNSALLSADLLDESGLPTEHYEPGAPLNLRVEIETTGMPGMTLEIMLRDANNLPVGFYSSSVFSQAPLPSEPGKYVCMVSLQPHFLASGEYSFDLATDYMSIVADHKVDNAVRFQVAACSPDGIAFDFTQSLGRGVHALRLAAPIQFAPLSEAPAVGEKQSQSG